MSSSEQLTRRELLWMGAVLMGSASLGQSCLRDQTTLEYDALHALAANWDHAAGVIGRRYLHTASDEASEEALILALREALGPAPLDRTPEGLHGRLREAVQRDFESGDVLSINRWRFARTEARLFALIELTQGDQ